MYLPREHCHDQVSRKYVIDPHGKPSKSKRPMTLRITFYIEVAAPSAGQVSDSPMLTEERRKLLKGANGAAWSIYSYLLAVNWKNLRQPVKLTNMALAEIGVFPRRQIQGAMP